MPTIKVMVRYPALPFTWLTAVRPRARGPQCLTCVRWDCQCELFTLQVTSHMIKLTNLPWTRHTFLSTRWLLQCYNASLTVEMTPAPCQSRYQRGWSTTYR